MKIVPSRNLPQLAVCGFLWRFRRLGGVTLPPMRLGRNKGIFWHEFKKESRTDFKNLPLIFCCRLKFGRLKPPKCSHCRAKLAVFTGFLNIEYKSGKMEVLKIEVE